MNKKTYTTELFYKMDDKDIPWKKTDPGYAEFWEKEKYKVERGIEIDGYKMTGWLYWHINHWKINADKMTDYGEIIPDMVTPGLRDNEIILNEELKTAERERKGISIMGLRQFAKTTLESSYTGRAGILFKGSQNLIMGTSSDDLNNLTQNLDYGLLNCSPYFRIPRITKDWGQERVLVGLKTKSGDNIVHSTFVIRNTIGGKNTEKGAGVSNLKSNIWDEIGKNDFLQALIGTKPAMLSEHGWRCFPICVGTGGNVEKAQDAKKLFFNPKAHTFIEHLQEDGRTTGLFLPGWLRQDCKYLTSLGKYLTDQGILKDIPKDSELWDIDIRVSDKEKGIKKIEEELEEFKKEGDIESYNRWKAYYPLNVDDVFLSESHNNFPVEACKAQQKWLELNYTAEYVDLFRNQKNKVDFRYSDNKPIFKFPVSAKDLQHLGKIPCSVYEHPDPEAPFATYCIGIDPYNENESSDKVNSLGSIHVRKRYYKPGDPFANKFVFSWTGRCKTVGEFHELCLMVMEYYNAIEGALPENEDKTMIQYVIMKKKGHYFAKSLDLSKQINQKTKSNRLIGLSASTPNQNHYMSLLVEDAKEEISTIDEDGNIEEYLGVSKILDPMLLEEYIQYKGKPSSSKGVHDGNYDRVISAGHALTLAKYYDALYPLEGYKPKPTEPTKPEVRVQTFFGDIVPKSKSPFRSENQRTPKTNINW
jgi:hypothetical protein